MTTPTSKQSGAATDQSAINILLVDDEARNLDVLESTLASPTTRLIRVQTAQAALLALLEQEFAAIILDIQMPGTSGIELAHLIKQRKRTQHIPIIFLTAYFQEDRDILQGYEVGAVDYLTKPVDPQILKSKIAVFVELFQKNRELSALNNVLEREIAQRQQAEEALRQANNELEVRVRERTAALTRANDDLRTRERELRASEKRLTETLSQMPASVYTCDTQGRLTFYNAAAVALWGREPKIGEDLWCGSHRIYRPDGTVLPPAQCPMAITLAEGRAVRGEEIVIERPDGTRCHVVPYPEPIYDGSGTLIGAINMLLDITETKRADSATQRLAAIIESSEDAIISKDLNGVITSWNLGAERLFGYKPEEIVGKSVTLLIPPERFNEESKILELVRRAEPIKHYQTVRRRKDGSLVDISLTISPIRDAQGKIIGASKIVRDITEQKRAERNLERAHKEAMFASRAKDDFLAALSHELRTPLNPVLLLASEAAEDPQLPTEVRARFVTIRNNVELEARLIDDLLDITRITHGKLSMDFGFVDAHVLLQEAIAIVRSELDQKRIELTTALAAERSTVKGDAVRLQQVFWNVLKNAVKFTSENGKISVGTRTQAKPDELIITVADSGIGMTSRELARIFETFAQGEHLRAGGTHRFGGLGLGLAISRKLVESHAGSIRAISAGRDQGATFIITFPLALEQPREERSPALNVRPTGASAEELISPIRILLVEDHEPTRAALANLLIRRHYEVKTAASVAEARTLAEKHAFQLLISDIGLPDGNGFELMKELRTGNRDLKGIALTGYGMDEDISRGQQAGFARHLTKPIRVQSLEAALAATVVK